VGESHAIISGDVHITYDTDVARSDAATAALRGLVQQDEIYEPDANLDLVKALGSQSLFLNGLVGYQFYGHDTILNNQHVDLTGGADLRVAHCEAALADEYAARQNDLAEITTTIVKNRQTVETVSFDGDCARAVGFTPYINVSGSWSSNSNPEMITTDYRNLVVGGGLAYQRPTFGRLSIFGQYVRTTFPNRLVPVGAVAQVDGYQLYSGGFKFERRLGRIEGTFQLAYTDLQPDISGEAKFNGLTYLGDLAWHATSRLTGKAHIERDTQPSVELGSAFTRQNLYSLELDYRFTSRLNVAAGASEDDARFEGAAIIPGIDLTSSNTTDYYGNVQLQFARRFSLTLDAREENRRANLVALSYASTRISATLSVHI